MKNSFSHEARGCAEAPNSETLVTKFLNVFHKSKHATLERWHSIALVSKRLTYETAACLRARYCTNLTCSDLNKRQKPEFTEYSVRFVTSVATLHRPENHCKQGQWLRARTSCSAAARHNLTARSLPPVANNFPSRENATL